MLFDTLGTTIPRTYNVVHKNPDRTESYDWSFVLDIVGGDIALWNQYGLRYDELIHTLQTNIYLNYMPQSYPQIPHSEIFTTESIPISLYDDPGAVITTKFNFNLIDYTGRTICGIVGRDVYICDLYQWDEDIMSNQEREHHKEIISAVTKFLTKWYGKVVISVPEYSDIQVMHITESIPVTDDQYVLDSLTDFFKGMDTDLTHLKNTYDKMYIIPFSPALFELGRLGATVTGSGSAMYINIPLSKEWTSAVFIHESNSPREEIITRKGDKLFARVENVSFRIKPLISETTISVSGFHPMLDELSYRGTLEDIFMYDSNVRGLERPRNLLIPESIGQQLTGEFMLNIYNMILNKMPVIKSSWYHLNFYKKYLVFPTQAPIVEKVVTAKNVVLENDDFLPILSTEEDGTVYSVSI